VEEETHEQLLMQENGIYANLFKLHLGGFILD
jgi:hypothetical protein